MLAAIFLTTMQATAAAPIGPGVSEALAAERRAAIRALRYELQFVIPEQRTQPVRGRVTARFTLETPHRIVLDFAQPADRVVTVSANGRGTTPQIAEGHLVVPAALTRRGPNEVVVEFVSGDESLNRNDEFLYTLFVPARAQFAFPCFDQPDIKARYTLALEVPDAWQAIGNGREIAEVRDAPAAGRKRVLFAETEPLPTYLFAFVAGRFSVETAVRGGRTMRLFHRETDAAKVARNRDALFDLHASALAWLEDYTSLPYAFGKFDLVLIPSFQFSGMEHPGAILYDQGRQLLDESATQNQLLDRASTIAHETAHMWFGDLVTMQWFNDVWMKEVFANFMAAKIVNPSFPDVNHDLRFLLAHYPSAYQVDRTAGANPIRQPLANLNEAGQLYGPIIYQKAPIVMRQLETMLGEQPFREGIREYLKRYAFGNATWLDLVRILDAQTPENVAGWSRAWVEQRGRPEFATAISLDARGQISSLALAMDDPLNRGLLWPQRLRIAIGYANDVRMVPAAVEGRVTTVTAAAGLERPLYVLPNGGGVGYGLFVLDDASRIYLLEHIEDVPDPLERMGDAVGQPAGWKGSAGCLCRYRHARVAPGIRRAERAASAVVRDARVLEALSGRRSPLAVRVARAGTSAGHRAGGYPEPEGGMVQRLSRYRVVSVRHRLARTGMAAGRDDSRVDLRRTGRDHHGAGTGGSGSPELGVNPPDSAGAHAKSGSESTLRVRHARAVR